MSVVVPTLSKYFDCLDMEKHSVSSLVLCFLAIISNSHFMNRKICFAGISQNISAIYFFTKLQLLWINM